MRPRALRWLIGLAVADVVAFALTIHAHVDYHHAKGDPTVMSLGQLMGWIVSGVLLLAIVMLVKEGRR